MRINTLVNTDWEQATVKETCCRVRFADGIVLFTQNEEDLTRMKTYRGNIQKNSTKNQPKEKTMCLEDPQLIEEQKYKMLVNVYLGQLITL